MEDKPLDTTMVIMALERLSDGQARTNEKVDGMVAVVNKIEVLLEKVANTQAMIVNETVSRKEADTRLHDRVDEANRSIEIIKKTQATSGCTAHTNTVAKFGAQIEASIKERNEFAMYIKENETWKNNIYKILMGKAFIIILGLIGVVYTNIKG